MFKPGDHFSKNYRVTEKVYGAFIEGFEDRNPLHTDESFAVAKGFRGKVMHGNILNGFLSHFIGECLPSKDVIIHSQQIQFNGPVFLNDMVILEAWVEELIESVKAIQFKFTFRSPEGKLLAKGQIQIGLI